MPKILNPDCLSYTAGCVAAALAGQVQGEHGHEGKGGEGLFSNF